MTYKHSKLSIFHFLFVLAIVILAYIYFGPCKQKLYISEKIEEAKRDSSIIALHNKKFNLEAENILQLYISFSLLFGILYLFLIN